MPRIHATSIGKVVASKIRSLKLLNSILSQLWRGKSGWKTKLLKWNNDYFYGKIEFADSKVCAKMMEKGMWCLNSGALFPERWPQSENWRDCKFSSTSMWVRIYGIPMRARSEKNLRWFAEMSGCITYFKWDDNFESVLKDFFMCKVEANTTNPISPGWFILVAGKANLDLI